MAWEINLSFIPLWDLLPENILQNFPNKTFRFEQLKRTEDIQTLEKMMI